MFDNLIHFTNESFEGNFFDRLIYKAVPDFIDFHVGNFHWFIFNVADIFITFGIFFMIIIELTSKNKN